MKALLFASMSVTAFALSEAISVPEPNLSPADQITWEDFGGAAKETSANWDAKDTTYSYKNGSFNMNHTSWQKGLTLNIGADMVFTANGTWNGPTGGERELQIIRIFDGGTFNVYGDWVPRYVNLQVDQGGTFMFKPKAFKSDNTWSQSWFDVYGTLDAPAGLKATGSMKMDIYTHAGSTIQLGGDVSKNGNSGATLRWRVLGGTIKATEDVHFDCAALEVAAESEVTIEVADGKMFDLKPFTIERGASFTKLGVGAVTIPSGIVLSTQNGVVLLSAAGAYDLSQVGFSEQGSLKIGAVGISITEYDSSLLSTTKLMLDSSLIAAGVTALTGPEGDTEFTEWAVKAINACIADGFEVVADGASIKVQNAFVKKTTTWTGAGKDENWSTEENWNSGKPATGDDLAFGEATKTTTIDDIQGLAVSMLTFGSEAPAYTFNGEQQLTVLDKIVNESSATQTLNLPIGLSGQAFELKTVGDIVFKTLTSSSTPLTKTGEGMATFSEGFAGPLAIAEGGVKVTNDKKLAETAGSVTINGTLDLDSGTLKIVQPDNSQITSIGNGAVLKNGTFNYSSDKKVYDGDNLNSQSFVWPSGSWTIGQGATVVTEGQIFEYGPDAPSATYGERRIVIDGGVLEATGWRNKYVIGVDEDWSKPAVIELKNGATLRSTRAYEFNIGARFSGKGTSVKAKGVVIANDSTIELADQLRILNENNDSNSSGILAMTNSILKLSSKGTTEWNDHHQLNASGKQWTDAQMILNHTEASFYRLLAKARVGSGISAGKMVGVLTLDGATLKPIAATQEFVYNDQAATKTIELLTDGATIDTGYDIAIPAIAYGVGGFIKKGTGTLTLSAANIYTGATTVEEGTLKLTGSVAGALVIGANGTLEVPVVEGAPVMGAAASLEFKEGAKLKIDLTGLDLTKKQPFLTLPTEGTLVGEPTLEIAGLEGGRWKVVARKTQDGVVCSVAPATGLVITIE